MAKQKSKWSTTLLEHMSYETKNITFHVIRVKVSSDSRYARTLPMNVAIEIAHCGCERNSCKDWI